MTFFSNLYRNKKTTTNRSDNSNKPEQEKLRNPEK